MPEGWQITAGGIEFVRTPDERFAGLDDFPHEPRYVDIDGLRMAYVDAGPPTGQPVLLLHGEPTWGYVYRRMIPPLVEAGHRCVVPDLVGFGRSDKPVERAAYTYNGHVEWLHRFLDAIELPSGAHLFAQDWGGLLGLRLVAERPGQFDRVAMGNTGLPTGEALGPGFDASLAHSQSDAFGDVGMRLSRAVRSRDLTRHEIDAYRAPFPTGDHLAGAIAFPALVPITPDHEAVAENQAAWNVLERWERPFLTLWGADDPVLGHLAHQLIDRIPGAAGQPHQTFTPGGHFIQDDQGEALAAALIDWWHS